MALSRAEIETLAAKLIDGRITSAEQDQLNAWLNEQMAKDSYELETSFAADAEELRQRMLARIQEAVGSGNQHYARPRRRLWLPYAAALIIGLVGALAFFSDGLLPDRQPQQRTEAVADGIPEAINPGGNRATLTLADGRKITLSESQAGIVVGEDNITYTNGTTAIDMRAVESSGASALSEPLILATPRGGTYQVILPDGSAVWLNANSTLKYPSKFVGDERIVAISGEAYFSVAKDVNRPFKVISEGQEIQVLGTAFNISAYPDDPETKTTLVEGAIQLTNLSATGNRTARNTVYRLAPGEQVTRRGAAIDIQQVDTDLFTAWKDGLFYFDGLSPQAAFAQLGRWYDIDVVYEGRIPTVRFFGMIGRDKSLASILTILEKSGVQFKVNQVKGRNQLIVLSE
ncbi:FecR domain-containing protein [Parapedobacter koreensis]|uniref:FecR family protein n=1 Tax=Parapedobacter koreensis TaxID=332977 RepID=A0A1H7EXR0_9SPHI|nr:FecR domain-containing protein [Parapedobacter koreensis]SEK17887.1 FecR family protein [Parapedobacter koreensis]